MLPTSFSVFANIPSNDFSYACRLIIKIILQWHLQFQFKSHILYRLIKIVILFGKFFCAYFFNWELLNLSQGSVSQRLVDKLLLVCTYYWLPGIHLLKSRQNQSLQSRLEVLTGLFLHFSVVSWVIHLNGP